MRAIPRSLLCCLLLVATAACGSTVPSAIRAQGERAAAGRTDELGGAPQAGTDASVPAAGVDSGGGATVAGSAGTGTTTRRQGSGSTVASAAPASSTIQVGVVYAKPADAGFKAIGASGLSNGDERRMAQLVVDDANARGGLGGRKIVPVYFGFDANPGAATIPQQAQEACSVFTEDNKVELVLGEPGVGPLTDCLSSRGIPLIGENSSGGVTPETLAKLPLMVHIGGFNLARRATTQVAALVRQTYFTGWNTSAGAPGNAPVKVGIITYDVPDFANSATNVLAPAVAAAGFSRPEVIRVAYHNSYGELSASGTQLANAVLRFKAARVTHVLIWDDNGIATLFFLTHAQSQGYKPRYGINTGNNMLLLTSAGLVNNAQAHGATGIGWRHVLDSPDAADPHGKYSNAPRRTCTALMEKGGGTVDGRTMPVALAYCSEMAAVKSQYDRLGGRLSGRALIAGFESIGSSFVNIQTPATYLGPGRHDGLAAYYDYGWIEGCSCMNYMSGPRPLPR